MVNYIFSPDLVCLRGSSVVRSHVVSIVPAFIGGLGVIFVNKRKQETADVSSVPIFRGGPPL